MDTVTTRYGMLQGEVHKHYTVFKGIPYARPPVGELRFAPPVKPEPWEGVRDATEFRAPSMQLFTDEHVTQPEVLSISSEDCLYLNVWTPAHEADEALPVYVFIHGGAYETGGGNMPFYAGDTFAERGIVYVNVNYRLNVFGSLALDTLEREHGTTGSYALQDALLAVKWVNENIAAFGGDPEKVTIGGESAGAFTVSALLHMKEAKGLFRAAILESGSIRGVATKVGYGAGGYEKRVQTCRDFIAELGFSDTPEGVAALRQMPAEELVQSWFFKPDGSARGIDSNPMLKGLIFEKDLMPDPRKQYVNAVDLLFGFNTDEGTMFVDPSVTADEYYGVLKEACPLAYGVLKKRYAVDDEHSAYARMAHLLGGTSFKASELAYAEAMYKAGKSVYGYHFDYLTDLLREQGLGVRHIAELNFVFRKGLKFVGADDAEGRRLSKLMNRAWANFIKNGDPNVGEPLTELSEECEWHGFDPTKKVPEVLHISHEVRCEELDGAAELREFDKALNLGRKM